MRSSGYCYSLVSEASSCGARDCVRVLFERLQDPDLGNVVAGDDRCEVGTATVTFSNQAPPAPQLLGETHGDEVDRRGVPVAAPVLPAQPVVEHVHVAGRAVIPAQRQRGAAGDHHVVVVGARAAQLLG